MLPSMCSAFAVLLMDCAYRLLEACWFIKYPMKFIGKLAVLSIHDVLCCV